MPPDTIAHLLEHPRIADARAAIESSDSDTLTLQSAASAIASPTGLEGRRAAWLVDRFRDAGLSSVRVDDAGNVHGWLGERTRGPAVVLAAHLDTVFGADVDVSVRKAQNGSRLEGPGISDNARGLAALVVLARVLSRGSPPFARPVLFAGTVGEEGSGDLRGVRHLFASKEFAAHAMIAVDGAGVERIIHRGVGSVRMRARFRGPGGHSWAAFGVANAASAVGRAASALAEIPIPSDPPSSLSVVRLGGGTGLNSIPHEAWLDLDIRSESAESLQKLEGLALAALERARDAENARRTPGTPLLKVDTEPLGRRPSGLTPRAHPLVQAALDANRALGLAHELAASSTDANLPMSLGIPAIALGAGGNAGDTHRTSEWYENTKGPLGIVRALLVTAAMAGVP
ncbi:MAG TPA: M20/M25/M40 family metallo-hydrolase [Gemmatimonadales bacterium]|nr:M20/M25/M40 family metallo-hydrolase [Gemmatimonadales bacterium]HXS24641.1 M20/M25/M40 family metallo-hydrolase [Gemmatimonadales bacterium]